jgi:hypothetical protein
MLNPTNTFNYLIQIRGRAQGLREDLRNSEGFSEALKAKKREWLEIYNNLAEELELRYFVMTAKRN